MSNSITNSIDRGLAENMSLAGGGGSDNVVSTTDQRSDTLYIQARMMEKNGNVAKAMGTYQEIIQRNDHRSGDAFHRLAILHDRQGDINDSTELYQKALERKPHDPDLHSDIGYSLYLLGHWTDAESTLRNALFLKPDLFRAHINLALVLAVTDRTQEAYSEFLAGGCNQIAAHTNLGFTLALQGRLDEAREQYQLALAADPSSKHAQEGLQRLDRLNTKLDRQVMTASFQPAQ